MVYVKAISSLEKVLLNDNYDALPMLRKMKAARGERISFQIAFVNNRPSHRKVHIFFKMCPEFEKYTHMSKVGHVPVRLAAYKGVDDNYISKDAGLYPDVLFPITSSDEVTAEISNVNTVWFTIDLPKNIKSGIHTVSVDITNEKDDEVKTVSFELEVKKTVMPKNDLVFTQWFHCDSIAEYFGVNMMSAKHWKLIEQFIKTAARTGITMLLTPLFTPPLDTAIGTERPTMQLVGVTKKGEKYEFDFTLLDRWVKLCRKYGIEYFEMSHLFTQWGVCACPKIVVNVDGKDEKLFGWHVASDSDMYKNFLTQFLPQLTAHLKELGIADKCYFHISDEPSADPEKPDYQNYLKAKALVGPYLEDFKIMDALSKIDYYNDGLVKYPVVSTNHIEPFLEADIEERWCYYCCGQGNKVSNRFLAMPSARNRILGSQLYLYDMYGFLQWGYNFYYCDKARFKIDPYITTDGDNAWPAGDPFSVYPYNDSAIESLRSVVFYDAIQDRMLFKALENKIGKDAVKKLILDHADGTLTFSEYPTDADFIISLHDKVLDMLG